MLSCKKAKRTCIFLLSGTVTCTWVCPSYYFYQNTYIITFMQPLILFSVNGVTLTQNIQFNLSSCLFDLHKLTTNRLGRKSLGRQWYSKAFLQPVANCTCSFECQGAPRSLGPHILPEVSSNSRINIVCLLVKGFRGWHASSF